MHRLNIPDLRVNAVILEEPARDKAAVEEMLLTPHKGAPHEILDDLKNKKDSASWGREFSEPDAGCLKDGI